MCTLDLVNLGYYITTTLLLQFQEDGRTENIALSLCSRKEIIRFDKKTTSYRNVRTPAASSANQTMLGLNTEKLGEK
jgi:hypothetical protein